MRRLICYGAASLLASFLLLVGCPGLNAELATQSSAMVAQTYQEVDPSKLPINFSVNLLQLQVDANGKIVILKANVRELSLYGRPIALTNDGLILEAGNAFVLTKEYGKWKITFDGAGNIRLWLTAKQREQLQSLPKPKAG